MMADRTTPNLPSRDFSATEAFYATLGFATRFKGDAWMILERGDVWLEFFPYPDLDPKTSSFGACLRVDDLDALYGRLSKAALPDKGIPRLTPPRLETFGLRMAALIDLDGSLVRCIENPKDH